MNRLLLVLYPALVAGISACTPPAAAAAFTVVSAGDGGDANPGDGIAITIEGAVSLRAAIEEANALPGADTIEFASAFPGDGIIPLTAGLPAITGESTSIDGTGITLDGGSLTGGPVVTISAFNVTITGLTITDAPQDAIQLNGSAANNCMIRNCKIGQFGDGGEFNGGSGIAIINGANNNVIGAFDAGGGNIIGGNNQYGVYINGFGTEENEVIGNFIGVDASTSVALANLAGGVFIGGGASQNIIGGDLATDGNLIAGSSISAVDNSARGVQISGIDTFDNTIQGNRIGVNAAGDPVFGHRFQGIFVQDSSGNLIGGTSPGQGNIIGDNGNNGVQINGANALDNEIRRNSIFDNTGTGIQLDPGANLSIFAPMNVIVVPDGSGSFIVSGAGSSSNAFEFFVDALGQGKTYIGTTNGDGNGFFTVVLDLNPYIGMNLTATQTDESGNTSAFSAPVQIGGDEGEGEGEGEGGIEGEMACFEAFCATAPQVDSDGDGLYDCFESNCLGTDPANLDSDGDGMPDNFEVDNGFDPAGPDESALDPDCDGLTNLEEFLGKSDPRDNTSPNPVYYVSATGNDAPGLGSKPFPWRTVAFALTQAAGKPGAPVRIYLLAGNYEEDVVFNSHIILTGPVTGGVSFSGNFTGAAHAELTRIRLSVPNPARPGLILPPDGPMTVREVSFIGTAANNQNGILVPAVSTGDSLITDSRFQRFAVAVNIVGPMPLIRRNIFDRTSFAGVYIQDSVFKGENPGTDNLGEETDSGTGFNTFGTQNTGNNVVNDTGETVKMENNDWSTNDEAAADAAIDGPADFVPFLPQGLGILGSSLAVTVWSAATLGPIENASVELIPGVYAPITLNINGTYRIVSALSGIYTVRVTAPGYVTATDLIVIPDAELVSTVFALAPLEGIHTADQDANNVINLSELLRIIQFYNTGAHHCMGGTEDGYAPGPGDESCLPHASDYQPIDWIVDLSEVLRLIQFFNLDGYYYCPENETEDGYCPGVQ